MCIKAGEDELDSVKALMTMSLSAIIADIFERDLDAIDPWVHMYADLNMDAQKRQVLEGMIAEYFDGLYVDFTRIEFLADLFEQVVGSAFSCGMEPEQVLS
jgi:hypothetical protein